MLTEDLEQLLWLPSTVNELSALLEVPRRRVHATLCQMRKQKRVHVLTHKREARRGPPSAIWGLAKCKFVGWMKV